MTDKSRDFKGKPVSKEEVLKELGDPAGWGKNEREVERERRGLDKRPTISGIKGYPGVEGYLDYLRESLGAPLGSNTGLVSDGKNAHIQEQEQMAIKEEIEKYDKILSELERSPEVVEQYLFTMKNWLEFTTSMGHDGLVMDIRGVDRNMLSDCEKEMYDLAKEAQDKSRKDEKDLKKSIEEYSQRLSQLKRKSAQ